MYGGSYEIVPLIVVSITRADPRYSVKLAVVAIHITALINSFDMRIP